MAERENQGDRRSHVVALSSSDPPTVTPTTTTHAYRIQVGPRIEYYSLNLFTFRITTIEKKARARPSRGSILAELPCFYFMRT